VAKIRVVTDSASDLPAALCTELGIDVVPLSIRFGNDEYTDRLDLTADEFWAKCHASSELPETAAPAPGLFQAAYQRALDDGCDGVIVVALSEALSATYQSATLGAQAMEGAIAVRVVNSLAVSMAQGLIALEVAEAAKKGATLDELVALCESAAQRSGVIATINTLEHLIKGGRLTGAKALLGSMLSVKPILKLEGGLVVEAGRARTRSKAFAACVDEARAAGALRRLAVVHGSADDVNTLVELAGALGTEIPLVIADIGPVVGTHGGPGIAGLCWLRA